MNVIFFSFAFLIGFERGFEAFVFSMVGMLQYVEEREEMEETFFFFFGSYLKFRIF
ncbi:hypothetical protein ACB092_01G036200 [Castanea dentata]